MPKSSTSPRTPTKKTAKDPSSGSASTTAIRLQPYPHTPISKSRSRLAEDRIADHPSSAQEEDHDAISDVVNRRSEPTSPSIRVAARRQQRVPLSSALPITKEEEDTLRKFDLDMKFGPNIGLTRLERWERANKFNLDPPKSVLDILRAPGRLEKKGVNDSLWNHL
ncbi:DNA polymerase delta, subunit 4-domain-containing protein [Chytriomyces sp. MP71]|nr:DNA polymerase delta, subunit 4-domain-containing protein [Chytriomyces sp. MP71]